MVEIDDNTDMKSQNKSELVSEELLSKSVSGENTKALEFYKKYKEIASITEKIDIAMGRKKIYKYSSGSTQNFEIDTHAIPPTVQSYKV